MTKANTQNILLVCIEFVQPLFSGNGILTQGLVRGLLAHSHGYHVTVLCARPESKKNDPLCIIQDLTRSSNDKKSTNNETSDDDPFTYARMNDRLDVVVCDGVPDETWKRLDRKSCWEIILHHASALLQENSRKYGEWNYALAIDWSALPTVYKLQELNIIPHSCKLVYLVFRVFSASKELCQSSQDYNFYKDQELNGFKKSHLTILLSHVDKRALFNELGISSTTINTEYIKDGAGMQTRMHILVPPLRYDIHHHATATEIRELPIEEKSMCGRHENVHPQYILCNARLSPEKNALRFAQIMQDLHKNKVLQNQNLTPLLIGAICDKNYADEVYALLPPNSIIVNHFMSSDELVPYLRQTVLNIHPAVYDAYGMTIVEAAAFCVPSIIHKECIGASSLLRIDHGEVFVGNMASRSEVYKHVEALLVGENSSRTLKKVGKNARERALSWGIKDYADSLHSRLLEK